MGADASTVVGIGFMILAALLFLAAIHPFTFYPWSLRRFPRCAAAAAGASLARPGSARPSLAICMSAYNEESVISAKVRGLIAMADAYGPAEILIYVDGHRDRTLEILDAFRDRVRVVASSERRGKTVGLKSLVAQCSSELIAFTDANVVAPADSLIRLEAALRDPSVGCASARLVYTNPGESDTSRSGAVYWSIEERVKAQESETVGLIGVDGALFMVRREAYESPPDDIIDDLYVSLTTLIKGYRVVSVPGLVVEERGATTTQEEFWRKARISCQAMNVHRLLWPRLRQLPPGPLYGYISHRLLKWLIPYLLLACTLCVAIGSAALLGCVTTLLLLLLTVGVIACGLAAKLRPVIRAAVYIVMLAGVATGVFESLVLGRRYVTWKPSVSVRAV